MNRNDLSKRWEDYCADFVPPRPAGFDPSAYVFDVKDVPVPEKLAKQMSPGDRLKRLEFHVPSADRGLGSFERSREQMADLAEFLKRGKVRMAFGCEPGMGEGIHVVGDPGAVADRDIWFVGDLHGDLLALRALLAFASSHSARRPVFVFLGDLFDRNPFGLNVLIEVLRLLRDDPDSVFLIAGNHDDGLEWSESGFSSRIQPHQFSDELNAFGDEAAKNLVRNYVAFARTLPVGLVLPNGLFAVHGGVPSRPERAVKNVWEGLDAGAIRESIAAKRSEFLCNRFQKDVSTGTKLSPDFSWAEIVNFSEAVEKAYGVRIRSMVRGHDHCDLCRHDWARSAFAGNDNCPAERADRVRDVLTMTSMAMMYKEEGLSGFLQEKVSFPTIARYRADDVRPEVFTVCFDATAALQYFKDARRPIDIEQARAVSARKASVVAERDRLRRGQDEMSQNLGKKRLVSQELDGKVLEARTSFDSWTRKKAQLAARTLPDNERILKLKKKIAEVQQVLDERKQEQKERDRKEQDGYCSSTRLDDLTDGLKELCRKAIGRSDDDLQTDIEEFRYEIVREQEELRARDPEVLKADKNAHDAELALTDFTRRLEDCRREIAELEVRQTEIVAELNKVNDALARCNEAERILGKESK